MGSRSRSRARSYTAGLAFVAALAMGTPADAARVREEFTKDFRKTVPMAVGAPLRLDHRQGNVRIRTHPAREAQIAAQIRVSASSAAEAAEFGKQIEIRVEESAEGLSVRTTYPDTRRSGSEISYSVDYDVLMPEDTPLAVRNRFGSVNVSGLKAAADVNNAHGLLTFESGRGEQRLENSFGGIEVRGNAGPVHLANSNSFVTVSDVSGRLDVRNRFGDVTALRIGQAAVVVNGNGNVRLTRVGAGSSVTNSFGAVSVGEAQGDVTVRNANGTVEVRAIAGAAHIDTSFGSVDALDVSGRLVCATSNSRVTASNVGGGVTIRNSMGAVELREVTGDVEVHNSNGAVRGIDIKGNASVRTSFAELSVASVGGNAVVQNANGAINLRDVGGAVDVRGSYGRIDVRGVKKGASIVGGNGSITVSGAGETFVKTTFGLVQAERIAGNLTVENANGGVKATGVQGNVKVRTSFAPVVLTGLTGGTDVFNQNGSIDVTLAASAGACAPVSLETSFSPLRITVPEGAGFAFEAKTSFGRIVSEIPFEASGLISGDAVAGKIGSGACSLRLVNSNGTVTIRKATVASAPPK